MNGNCSYWEANTKPIKLFPFETRIPPKAMSPPGKDLLSMTSPDNALYLYQVMPQKGSCKVQMLTDGRTEGCTNREKTGPILDCLRSDLSWFNWWVSFAPEFQCCYFCESSCLFYLSFKSDFYVSKIRHL